MPDYGTRFAEKALDTVERKVHATYRRAAEELQKKLADFARKHKAKDALMRKKVEDGLITEQSYKSWLQGQLFMEKQWKDKIDQCAKVMLDANREAMDIVHNGKLDIFAENYNHSAYELEKAAGNLGFNVYNTESVSQLTRRKPSLLPKYKIDEDKDYKWNVKKVRNSVSHGIIQGESVDQITDRLVASLCTQNENKMRMFARTSVTSAQNAGRIEQMHDAEDMGINVKKRWLATLDDRTRDTHAELDGQEEPVDEPFEVDGMKIMFPGDPNADPGMVFNCRCTLIQVYEGIDRKSVRRDEEGNLVEDMTYKEWKEWKEGGQQTASASEQRGNEGILEDMRDKMQSYSNKITEADEKIKTLEDEFSKLSTESLTKFGTDEYDGIIQRMDEVEKEVIDERAKSDELRDERNKYLLSNGENELIEAFGKIDGEHSIDNDVLAVNKITGDERSQKNCGSTSLAYDARRRGINCQAELTYGVNNNTIESWWDGLKMQNVTSYYTDDARNEIAKTAEGWGNGARGIVEIGISATSGHYISFEVENGRCIFLDSQSGIKNADFIFDIARRGDIKYGRTDDKALTKNAFMYLRGGSVEQD